MTTLAQRITPIRQLSGWRRRSLAFCLGICATLTLAPFFAFPLIIPAYGGLFILIYTAPTSRRAFADGWWWGWGFYIAGLYWFCIALLTEPDKFAWLIPFSLFGLNAIIALYPAVACWLFYKSRLRGLSAIFIFSVIWTCVEYARGHLFSGFPWNLPGYAIAFSDASLQMASLVGVYGVSWWVFFLGVAPAVFCMPDILRARAQTFILTLIVMLTGLLLWGDARINAADRIPENERYVEGVRLRLVQGNIPQEYKWDPNHKRAGLREYIRLTQSPGLDKITHVIWPETAMPFMMDGDAAKFLGAVIPPKAHLITGTLREEGKDANWQIWNSLVDISGSGKIVGIYDKNKLVPFGEFQPIRPFVPKNWMTPVGEHDFSSGPGMQTLHWPGLPGVSPLICYEVIFPERAVNSADRPSWLLSVTNDAWFGTSTGPYQHFHMAQMRAVEQGLPLIRVANTGITAGIDSLGRITHIVKLGEKGVVDLELQKPQRSATIYGEYKELFLLLLIVISVIMRLRAK